MSSRILWLAASALLSVSIVSASSVGCGSSTGDTAGADGSTDGSLADGSGGGDDGGGGDGGGGPTGPNVGNNGGWNGTLPDGGTNACRPLGQPCAQGSECCTGACNAGSCQPPVCVYDGKACGTNADCCSGTCTNGACAALNTTCKTLGNGCSASTDCCSKLCQNGICAQPSYCGQAGDVCTVGTDCCGGVCTKATSGAQFGTCGQPPATGAQCSMVDGVVCAGTQGTLLDGGIAYTDGGLPACGGSCCSRLCAPWGPTGVLICQPASGCRPVGDICAKDTDCCGGPGVPGPLPSSGKTTVCAITAPNTVGVCQNPQGCKPNGDICRLQTNQCNATDECCSGNVQQHDTCKQDNLGIPRCTNSACAQSGQGCATSADCCNGTPCVPNPSGSPEFVCAATQCIPTSGLCTTNADCCEGNLCNIPPGGTKGTCTSTTPPPPPPSDGGSSSGDGGGTTDSGSSGGPGTDSGTVCAVYGQTCAASSDCCNGVPCTLGRCEYPLN